MYCVSWSIFGQNIVNLNESSIFCVPRIMYPNQFQIISMAHSSCLLVHINQISQKLRVLIPKVMCVDLNMIDGLNVTRKYDDVIPNVSKQFWANV